MHNALQAHQIDGRALIPVGIGFLEGVYVVVSENETWLLIPDTTGAGYRVRAQVQGWERFFSSLRVAVAYLNTIERDHTVPQIPRAGGRNDGYSQ
jgi:hypothetical protein